MGEDAGGHYDGWYKPDDINQDRGNTIYWYSSSKLRVDCGPKPENASENCKPKDNVCLYDIAEDPCEYINIADKHPDIVQHMLKVLSQYNVTAVAPMNPGFDPAANPANHNGAWVPWVNSSSPEDIRKYGLH
uniref:Arylsulfatase I-like n=1 Tax=Saccoglossus kowalevskii TaxID=10224 RepID=A0ABM0N0W3_SACKO|nr:PREDICTED: arylsulfatase I-like [Saccoglossus kowalevskii]